ncbi:hypothetical protein GCM10009759_69410 [Kitasatospora saccharophila]|uniref:Uncharacterized protein n=1 Tax=Kitasatospora saccharophila TaxID=407973 RepID=A0ABP5JQL8_9ACTN
MHQLGSAAGPSHPGAAELGAAGTAPLEPREGMVSAEYAAPGRPGSSSVGPVVAPVPGGGRVSGGVVVEGLDSDECASGGAAGWIGGVAGVSGVAGVGGAQVEQRVLSDGL